MEIRSDRPGPVRHNWTRRHHSLRALESPLSAGRRRYGDVSPPDAEKLSERTWSRSAATGRKNVTTSPSPSMMEDLLPFIDSQCCPAESRCRPACSCYICPPRRQVATVTPSAERWGSSAAAVPVWRVRSFGWVEGLKVEPIQVLPIDRGKSTGTTDGGGGGRYLVPHPSWLASTASDPRKTLSDAWAGMAAANAVNIVAARRPDFIDLVLAPPPPRVLRHRSFKPECHQTARWPGIATNLGSKAKDKCTLHSGMNSQPPVSWQVQRTIRERWRFTGRRMSGPQSPSPSPSHLFASSPTASWDATSALGSPWSQLHNSR